jgi:4-hydroxybenzoate polyprenyltransferase
MTAPTNPIIKPKSNVRVFLEMIKFEHSIFALPYAMLGMMWASKTGWPGFKVFGLILVAMVSCRTAAMAYNRIADRDIDAINDRTKMRAIPAGLLSLKQVSLYFWIACAIFLVSASLLNPLTLLLSPVALFVTAFYSKTKRFTWLCHYWLGLSLGIAPTAAWISVTGEFAWRPIFLTLAVMFWTAGFDIIYALQDEEFDRSNGLNSVPAKFGKAKALTISRVTHLVSLVCLVAAFFAPLGVSVVESAFGFVAVMFAGFMLIYEQSLVKPHDLSKVNMAFFTLNGFISVGVFVFALIDHLVSR